MQGTGKRLVGVAVAGLTFTPTIWMLKRKSENPDAGWAHSLMNTLLEPQYYFKSGPFANGISVTNVAKAAQEEAKLSDFGNTNPEQLFSVTTTFLESEAYKSLTLSPFGYLAVEGTLKIDMVEYLKRMQFLKDVPAVGDIKITAPTFIVGLFRSGTTNLHRLLAMDPARRSAKLWELGKPTPNTRSSDPEDMRLDRMDRRKKMLEGVEIGRAIGDWERFDALHKVDVDLPEECQVSFGALMPIAAAGPFFFSAVTTPGFMEQLPIAAGYADYKKVLQVLSYQDKIIGEDPEKKWVMKGPIHLFGIKPLAQTFPDAQLIWIHRDPIAVVPSMCSLIDFMCQFTCEHQSIDRAALGKGVKAAAEMILSRAPQDIQESGLKCCHVKYDDVIKDPIDTVKKIYSFYGWAYTDEYDGILRNYVEKDKAEREELIRFKTGRHRYSLERYGLDNSDFGERNAAISDYMKKFGIQRKV